MTRWMFYLLPSRALPVIGGLCKHLGTNAGSRTPQFAPSSLEWLVAAAIALPKVLPASNPSHGRHSRQNSHLTSSVPQLPPTIATCPTSRFTIERHDGRALRERIVRAGCMRNIDRDSDDYCEVKPFPAAAHPSLTVSICRRALTAAFSLLVPDQTASPRHDISHLLTLASPPSPSA